MAGINRALLSESIIIAKASLTSEKPCIFLSHVSEDKESVKEIGKYIMNYGDIDIYLDINDTELQIAVNNNDPIGITYFIEKGIRSSTHLMCLYSEKTVRSWWVPYEIGYGKRSSAEVSSLKLKGNVELPAYLKISEMLLGTESLNRYLEKISKKVLTTRGYKQINESLISHSASPHPLDNYLDWKK
ncbi:MAG: toll/interleukin-1 receptor domain-containing protein [Desulfamplus sp.]|nr:toll/interleukin-1 receptor domain-containing protein [Desulfamplus sp.]